MANEFVQVAFNPVLCKKEVGEFEFIIELHKSLAANKPTLDEKGLTLDSALEFVSTFVDSFGVIVHPWAKHDGRYVMNVYAWLDSCDPPPPPCAWIIAPCGWALPDSSD